VSADQDYPSPAARQLGAYLQSLREDAPRPGTQLVPTIVRRARWQHVVRAPLWAAGTLVAALADGVSALVGTRTGSRR
jgi:dolichol kinase